MDEIDNLEKIRVAATESGATEFIDKLEDGFESSFTGEVEMETPETLYKAAVEWDEMSSDDDEEEEDESEDATSVRDKDEVTSDTTSPEKGGDSGVRDHLEDSHDIKSRKQAVTEQGEVLTKEKEKGEGDDWEGRPGRLAFSGGQRQKLVMARSFMRSTDLAIFDE